MENADRFEDLDVWKKGRELSSEIFLKTKVAPFSRDFGLANQINRATGSVIDNIAEGFERNGNGEYAYFLTVAKGSAGEVRAQLYRAFDRKYLTETEFEELREKSYSVSRMLSTLRKRVIESEHKGSRFKKNR